MSIYLQKKQLNLELLILLYEEKND
jgi:hypothetical protein